VEKLQKGEGTNESDESGSLNCMSSPVVPAVSACRMCIDHPPSGDLGG
jgi:hypothetical protein